MLRQIALFTALFASTSFAQEPGSGTARDKPKPIQDNSFLIEEAYNQEKGVVQHINTFFRQRNGDWTYTFTQEWPITSQKHQLSFTVPGQSLKNGSRTFRGLGDIALNYRYQLVGSGETTVAVAPRISLLLPTGNESEGLGSDAVGVQFNLPTSIEISRFGVTHLNVGMTLTPSAKNDVGQKADLQDFHAGQSFIWLAGQNFNVMLEGLWESEESVIGSRSTRRDNSFLLSPGIRWAHNFKNGLQIVPGIAVPVGLGPSRGERGIFLYISFEHPFGKTD